MAGERCTDVTVSPGLVKQLYFAGNSHESLVMLKPKKNSVGYSVLTLSSFAAALVLGGCSVGLGPLEVSTSELESVGTAKLTEIAGRKPDALDCPEALPAKEGSTVRCVLTDGDQRYGVTFTSNGLADDGESVKFDLQVDSKPMD